MKKMKIFLSVLILFTSFTCTDFVSGVVPYTDDDMFIKKGKDSFEFYSDSLLNGAKINVFTYLPSMYNSDSKILFVMHGVNRNASEYRDQWSEIAERNNALLIVPEFSTKNFPEDVNYNMGNMFVMGKNDTLISSLPESEWSYSFIEPIFDSVKSKMKNKSKDYLLFGHSAGAQFVHRFLFFVPKARILKAVSANAGWYTLPDFETLFPYGLKKTNMNVGDLKSVFKNKEAIIMLGEADTSTTQSTLRRTPEAMIQGKNRWERGHYFFEKCKEEAAKLNTEFNWQIKTAPGVGHSNTQMSAFAESVLFKN
ncbi:MAG: hypothetical protein WC879_18895 [Melioribacteraceae bacterium]